MRAEDAPYPTCPDCASTLQLHELDPTGPGCLLGRCPACRAIFPVFSESGSFEVVGRATLRVRPPRGRRRRAGKTPPDRPAGKRSFGALLARRDAPASYPGAPGPP